MGLCFPGEGEKGMWSCHTVHAPYCSPAPYQCMQITGTLEKNMSSEIFFILNPFASFLDKWQQTKKLSRGMLAGCLSPSPGPLDRLLCSFPILLLPWSWMCGQMGACAIQTLLKVCAGLCAGQGTSGHWSGQTTKCAKCPGCGWGGQAVNLTYLL